MIAPWIAYCLGTATLLALAGATLERLVRLRGAATRWIWAGVLAGSLLLPAGAWLAPPPAAPAAPLRDSAPATDATAANAPTDWTSIPVAWTEAPDGGVGATLRTMEGALLPLWLASSGAVLLLLLASATRIRRHRARWGRARLDGVPVRVSSRTGPAVVGIRRGEIVVPEWATGLPRQLRSLMIAHEREHLRAGDPRLLLAALLALAAMPWNPALWWQLRRLRLAVEADCDARVLRAGADVRVYGALLLEVGRRSAGLPLLAATLSEPASLLERRIQIMTTPRSRVAPLRMAAFAAGAALLFAAACGTPRPAASPPPVQPEGDFAAAEVAAPLDISEVTTPPKLQNAGEIAALLAQHYPPLLRDAGVTGRVLIHATVDEDGETTDVQATEASHAEFGAAAVATALRMRFTPAEMDGKPVAVRFSQPIAFNLPVLTGPAPATSDTTPPQLVNAAQVARAIDTHYPPLLRDAGVTGRATVQFDITREGRVENLHALEATHYSFAEAGVSAMRQARFKPATWRGEPVRYRVTQPVTFNGPARGPQVEEGSPNVSPRTPNRQPASDTLRRTPHAVLRAAIERHYPASTRAEGAATQPVVFVADSENRVLDTGVAKEGQFPTAEIRASPDGARRITIREATPGSQPRRVPLGIFADIDPDLIDGIEIFKGAQVSDLTSAGVIWIRLKPGARLQDAG